MRRRPGRRWVSWPASVRRTPTSWTPCGTPASSSSKAASPRGGRVRFVDEYRDAAKARALAARIARLCDPGRQYRFMEVCGGHTHTIYQHGLADYLPENVTLVHGPG